jgi:ATP-GRASP peptide maturase of grasp-with-spasm system
MKEILIQSTSDDGSTDDVIAWLYYLNEDIKISGFFDHYNVQDVSLSITNKDFLSVTINNIKIDKETSSWYRRGKLISTIKLSENYLDIQKGVYNETLKPIIEFLDGGFSNKQINNFKDNYVGKLDVLYHALQLKIKIPDVLITGDSKELNSFVVKHKKVITKPIRNPFINISLEDYQVKFSTQTKLISIDDIAGSTTHFMPSFFQKYIEKKYEIRTFYVKGDFKSMAIFSQQNEKTKIDFRNYDHRRPNRCVPYQLPKRLEKKLHKLMLKLNMNCGSFDIICTPQNKYFFLEVNPIGQFQWLSRNCNYYIERLISIKMMENE